MRAAKFKELLSVAVLERPNICFRRRLLVLRRRRRILCCVC